MRPVLDGRRLDREYVVSELSFFRDLKREGRMVRSARYKYVCFNAGARAEQLFDLERDPGETRNLAGSAEYAGELARHRKLLRNWIEETQDRFEVRLRKG